MKKLLTILLATSLLVVACGKDKETKDVKNEATVTEEQTAAKPVEVAEVTTREMSKLFESSAVWEPLAKVDFSTYKDAEWIGGVQVSWKVFSFGKDLDSYKVAKLEEEQEELKNTSTKENIEINVKSAYLNVISLEKQVASQKKAMEAAKSNFEMNQEKYDAGLISTIDYLDFENTYRQATIAYNKALLDYYYAFETYRSLLI